METILVEKKYLSEYIIDSLNNAKVDGRTIENAKYHHNSSYQNAALICKYGILTLYDLNKYGIRHDDSTLINKLSDINSHVNGIDGVSLSVVNLKDLYAHEEEYNPFVPEYVDFLVSSDIKTNRLSINYGNEFLSYNSIEKDKLRSVDIRLIEYIKLKLEKETDEFALTVIEKYNQLKKIASEIQNQSLNIPLREMSESTNFELNLQKVINQPTLILKK